MKEEFLKRIAYDYQEINSYHTIEKMNSIEQLHFNFLPRLVLMKLVNKIEKIKQRTGKDYFIQTDAISKLEHKINKALNKVA